MRELLLLYRAQAGLHGLFVFYFFHIAVAHAPDRAREKAAGAAGRIEQNLARFGVDAIHHKSGDGARSIILARVAGALQIVEQLFVNAAEVFALCQVVEVHAANFIDHLPHQLARLHVVVGVFKHAPHHTLRVSQHSVSVSVRSKKPLAVKVNHVVGSICHPDFRLPRNLPKVFQKTSTTEKSSHEHQARLATSKQSS